MADETDTLSEGSGAAAPSSLPLILTLSALLLFFGYQTMALMVERGNLSMVKSNQEGALQEAQKIQTQFKLLVTKTGELADQGHAGAKMVMEGLQRQGVGFGPDETPPAKAAAKKTK
jgi:hypothetical protein